MGEHEVIGAYLTFICLLPLVGAAALAYYAHYHEQDKRIKTILYILAAALVLALFLQFI